MYTEETIPKPETLYDDYSERASAAAAAEMRVGRDAARLAPVHVLSLLDAQGAP
jgi:hypothetical protein